MIDRVRAFEPERLVAEARVPEKSPVFEGHFPGFPIMPGVLMVETMAQACGWLVIARSNFSRIALLAKVEQAKMRGMVKPGASLVVTAELVHDGSGYAVMRGQLAEGEARVAEAELTLRVVPYPSPDLEAAVRSRAAQIGLAA
ncbi:3-hydroxyacyl-ACP dehydratase FabZ family protein [Roseococcus sp. YIM B11640]|uniref:3-hydroxyacyl-ACP dehydratase FabZ family protein n=1 Tax=Roseococcus sp. YIM B11640 TaxID=3133973 RepID=UPI003C7DEB18